MTRALAWKELFDAIDADKPTYTYNSTTYTYDVFSAFPESDPSYPCIVIHPFDADVKKIGVTRTVGKTRESAEVEIEFFALIGHGKNAIDSAKDDIQSVISNLNATYFIVAKDSFKDLASDKIEFVGQGLNTGGFSVKVVLL